MNIPDNLKQIEPNSSFQNIDLSNFQHTIPSLNICPPDMSNIKNPMVEELKNTNKILQNKLDSANLQLKQLNDKNSSQNLYIKELKADLEDEKLKRELAETKLSSKDWKLIIISFFSATTVLAIEHWKDIYTFILFLIEKQ